MTPLLANRLTRRTFAKAAAFSGALAAAGALAPRAHAVPAATFAGGSGTPEDPWQIADADQLAAIAGDLTASYRLAADIDLSGAAWTPLGLLTYGVDVDMETGEMDASKMFSGTLDGDGHAISGLTCVADADMAACGLIAFSTGSVRDLTVAGFDVDGGLTSLATGGVVGYAVSGTVENVRAQGCTVRGVNCTGCIVGGNAAVVEGCTVEDGTVVVAGDNDFSQGPLVQCDVAECGGLVVGGSFMGSVNRCTASGTVMAEGSEPVGLGGIGGCIQCIGSITGNRATVTIECGDGHAVGGLCGYAGMGDDGDGVVDDPCVISDCAVEVAIRADGATHVGGLVGTGLYFFGMEDRFVIEDCSVSGTIDGAVDPGAVAGRAVGSEIVSCAVDVTIDGKKSDVPVGRTARRYESADQYEEGSKQAAVRLFDAVAGTYAPLFDTLISDDTYQLWYDDCAAAVGERDAEAAVEALQGSVTGALTGEEAVEAYGADPEATAFYCGFLGDVAQLTFDGTTFSGTTEAGEEVFSHGYAFDSYDPESGFYAYRADDPDAGDFAYVVLLPDTPAHTFHIELRYGADLAALNQWTEGEYAYWMGAGLPVGADEAMVANGIALFCAENLA